MGYETGRSPDIPALQVGQDERSPFVLYFHKNVADAKRAQSAPPDLGSALGGHTERRGNVAVILVLGFAPTKADWSALKRCLRS